jgi:hypothetical protein
VNSGGRPPGGVVRTKKGCGGASFISLISHKKLKASLSDEIVHIVVGVLHPYDPSPVCGLLFPIRTN